MKKSSLSIAQLSTLLKEVIQLGVAGIDIKDEDGISRLQDCVSLDEIDLPIPKEATESDATGDL